MFSLERESHNRGTISTLRAPRIRRGNQAHPLTVLALCVGLIGGCGTNEPNSTTEPEGPRGPGAFAVQMLESLGRDVRKQQALSAEATFDLGSLPATSAFYFMVSNTGGSDITGITLTTDSQSFPVSPTGIDALVPEGTSVLPIVKVVGIHGLDPFGLGYAPLLAPGVHNVDLTIAGTSLQEPVTLTVHLSVEALVMDVAVSDDGGAVDLTDPSWTIATSGRMLAQPGFDFVGTPTITNTGNVAVEVTVYPGTDPSVTHNLGITESLELVELETYCGGDVGVDAIAVSDPTRLKRGADGTSYFTANLVGCTPP